MLPTHGSVRSRSGPSSLSTSLRITPWQSLRGSSMADRYVQYGCGLGVASGWENYDASPTLRLERLPLVGRLVHVNQQRFPPGARYGDILRGLPVPKASCAGVYCSHVIEHLAKLTYLGRAGEAEEVAGLIAFLASSEADFITGEKIVIDGGRSLGQ